MSSDFQHYSFRMPNIGFQNLPLNIYIVVFGTAIFVFILSLLFCCYLIRLRHQAHKELYAYKQVILKEKVKELNLHEICAVCLEEFKPKDELGICPCKHAFHRKLLSWSRPGLRSLQEPGVEEAGLPPRPVPLSPPLSLPSAESCCPLVPAAPPELGAGGRSHLEMFRAGCTPRAGCWSHLEMFRFTFSSGKRKE
ncbi:PREDICTED: RING finger protein 24 [Aptenodytes forsteri]|uniref:RING finger protein 24 n=1 Tax=Aptenodytes forsteri TaxID=9233 RepID=UPI0004F4A482|nr:PREDICTED: RING finger protein 24 [Aptenodytes forsteri]